MRNKRPAPACSVTSDEFRVGCTESAVIMDIPAPFHRLIAWFKRQSRITRDLVVMGAVGLPLYLLAVWYDAFDKFLALTHEPESDAIDWLIILFVFLGIAAKIFSVRRVADLHREVRERRIAEEAAHQLARHDVLTGLPNRRRFIEDFEKAMNRLPEGEAYALFVVDLDNFKPINDVYGHRLGDEVLRVIARRLVWLAEGGTVARLGGDEFGILLHHSLGSDAPERLARRIVHEISKPIPLAALALQVGVSVGVATSRPDVPPTTRDDEPRRRPGRDGATPSGHGHVLGQGRGSQPLPLLRSQPWTRSCNSASSSRPRSGSPSLPARSFPITSRSSTSRAGRRSVSRCWRAGSIRPKGMLMPDLSSPSPRTPAPLAR